MPRTIMFNPQLQAIGDEKFHVWEACLSVPGNALYLLNSKGYWGKVLRYKQAKVAFLDEKGDKKCIKATGFLAAVLQVCWSLAAHDTARV